MPSAIRILVATEAALDKLGARGISDDEAEQVARNRHVVINNLRGDRNRPQPSERRLLIGRTNGGRALTLVIEKTLDGDAADRHRMGRDAVERRIMGERG